MKSHPTPYTTLTPRRVNLTQGNQSLFAFTYLDIAIRMVQRKYREKLEKKSWYKDHKHSRYKFKETLRAPLSFKIFQEPTGNQFEEYAKKINEGKELDLNFDDPDFILNLYKAFRLGKINIEQLVDVYLLEKAQIEFKKDKLSKILQIRKVAFNEKGPYSLQSINYAEKSNINDFYKRLQKIPESKRCYYSINFSRARDIAFLLDGITFPYFRNNDLLIRALTAYINKSSYDLAERREFLYWIFKLKNDEKSAAENIAKFILQKEKSILDSLSKKDRESSQFLINLLHVEEKMPSIVISPDHDLRDSSSPLLSFIVPTTSALHELSCAMHNETDVVQPFFTTGQPNIRMMRALEELPQPARSVELTHPMLKPTDKPHGSDAHDFILTWHDLFHCWRSSATPTKPLIRYLRQLLTTKGHEMSKPIFGLTDMDFSGHVVRATPEDDSILASHLQSILSRAGREFWKETQDHDDNLFLIIDMIANKKLWKKLLFGRNHKKLFFESTIESWFREPIKNFIKTYQEIENLMTHHPLHSHLFYIVLYRLSNHKEDLSVCKLAEQIGWDKIIYWKKNKKNHTELCFRGEHNKTEIEMLSSNKIREKLYQSIQALKINPEEYISTQLKKFIQNQIERLQKKSQKKGATLKIKLYSDLLKNISPNKSLKDVLFRCATISHHRRMRTRDKILGLFSCSSKEAMSWKAFKEMTHIMLTYHNLTAWHPTLLDCLNPKKWILKDSKNQEIQGYDGKNHKMGYRNAVF